MIKAPQFSESAISESLGVIFLIAVISAGILIAGAAVFSQPVQEAVPGVRVNVAYDDDRVYLYHDGGEALRQGEFKILFDGAEQLVALSDGDWRVGETLDLPGSPSSVQVVFSGSSRSDLLHSIPIGEEGTGFFSHMYYAPRPAGS
jgi:hypothetical protein